MPETNLAGLAGCEPPGYEFEGCKGCPSQGVFRTAGMLSGDGLQSPSQHDRRVRMPGATHR